MGERYVHTPIGIIDADDKIEGYICSEKPRIILGKEIIIKSCKTKVVITNDDGSEETIQPILLKSCMNPEIKTIMPLTFRVLYNGSKKGNIICVSNGYEERHIDIDGNAIPVRTEKYIPD